MVGDAAAGAGRSSCAARPAEPKGEMQPLGLGNAHSFLDFFASSVIRGLSFLCLVAAGGRDQPGHVRCADIGGGGREFEQEVRDSFLRARVLIDPWFVFDELLWVWGKLHHLPFASLLFVRCWKNMYFFFVCFLI